MHTLLTNQNAWALAGIFERGAAREFDYKILSKTVLVIVVEYSEQKNNFLKYFKYSVYCLFKVLICLKKH
jgi:hypothetical protein